MEFPQGDPNSLIWWLEEEGAAELGRDINPWMAVIDYASAEIRGAHTASESRAFRDAALSAAEMAFRLGVVKKKWRYVCQATYTRVSYLMVSDESDAWRFAEMKRVLDQVLETVPLDLASARSQSVGWHTKPAATIQLLAETKTLIKRMQPAANYLTGTDREILDQWLRLVPQLP